MFSSVKIFLKNYGVGLIAVFVTWGAYFTALWPKIIFRTDYGVSVSGALSVWGDWAAHFAYANVFAYRGIGDWLISHPLYAGFPFSYPFATDAISGLLMRLGMERILSFILPSVVTTFLLLAVLYVFLARALKGSWRAFAAVTLFLASGGLGFLFFFADLSENFSLQTLLFPPKEYTRITGAGIEWLNVLPGEFLPQRPFLLGFPVTLLVLMKLSSWAKSGFKDVPYRNIALLGLAAGFIALIHVHSLIALAIFSAIIAFYGLKHWRKWTVFAVSAAVSALIVYLPLYSSMVGETFFRWRPGWLALNSDAPLSFTRFWILNWGVFLPFSLLAVLRLRAYKNPLVVGGIVIFVLANLFQFQPHFWDNAKLFTWSYLMLAIPAADYLGGLWRRGALKKAAVLILFTSMIASGTLDIWRLTKTDKTTVGLWSRDEEFLAEKFRDISEPTDVVLTSDKHNHWVPMLSGRQIILGYRGWAWTYGINYYPIEQDVRAMFAGGNEAIRLLDEYKVKYVVIGPTELNDYGANEKFFSSRFEKVLEGAGYRVYRINVASG